MSAKVVRIKICGITNGEDARAAIDYGADALGFIFVPDTPRYVGGRTEKILRGLPPFVSRVAVCAQLSSAALLRELDFDTVQYYDRDVAPANPNRQRLVHAFRIKDENSLEEIAAALAAPNYRPHALHLDAYHPNKLGGAGATFNWQLAVEAKQRFGLPIILAGGLTPDNVAEAVRTVRPYAVDVSSGIEAEPARKDHAKLRAFIQAVRGA